MTSRHVETPVLQCRLKFGVQFIFQRPVYLQGHTNVVGCRDKTVVLYDSRAAPAHPRPPPVCDETSTDRHRDSPRLLTDPSVQRSGRLLRLSPNIFFVRYRFFSCGSWTPLSSGDLEHPSSRSRKPMTTRTGSGQGRGRTSWEWSRCLWVGRDSPIERVYWPNISSAVITISPLLCVGN